jgi:hypothetical protein
MSAELDNAVRLHLYSSFIETGTPPTVRDTATWLAVSADDVAESYRRLAAGRVILLKPGTNDVLMANPFSAVPTRFRVTLGDGRSYFGNCIWDALGIPVMLARPARIDATCGECDHVITLEAAGDGGVEGEGVVHFGVPAARWWDDIVFT